MLTDGGTPRGELLAAIAGTHLARTVPEGFPGELRDHIYLVDPLGNLMMRFPRDPDASKMLKGLQRLLLELQKEFASSMVVATHS